jgi:hypothetical protein
MNEELRTIPNFPPIRSITRFIKNETEKDVSFKIDYLGMDNENYQIYFPSTLDIHIADEFALLDRNNPKSAEDILIGSYTVKNSVYLKEYLENSSPANKNMELESYRFVDKLGLVIEIITNGGEEPEAIKLAK